MAQVLSLKEIRTSSALKEEIKKLEDDILGLREQLDRQKKVEQKLNDDILSHRKDFEHLEKQFNHFAGLEADYEALQQELQMERLEKLIQNDQEDNKSTHQIKKVKEDLSKVQTELKELKKLDPQRLKKQVTDLKKKNLDQSKDNKNLNSALVSERKEVKELTADKTRLEAEVEAASKQLNFFWQSEDETWALFETALVLKDEEEKEDSLNRIQCLNRATGASVVSTALGEDEKATWSFEFSSPNDIPEEVSIEAGKRLKHIAAEAEEEDE